MIHLAKENDLEQIEKTFFILLLYIEKVQSKTDLLIQRI
jgi:hypothetical protein